MSNTPSGWYPDPKGHAQQRWYDGANWTDFVMNDGTTFVDAPGPGAPPPPTPPPQHVVAPPPTMQPAAPGVAHYPVQKPVRSAGQKMAFVAVAALVVGGVLGYVVRGDGGSDGGGSGGGGGSSQALSTPLLEGMASLDSYEWQITVANVGPTAADRTEMSGNGASDSAQQLRYMRMTNTSASADDTEGPSTSTTETWRTADTSCTFDGEQYAQDSTNPFESDLGTVLSGVFDIVIPKGNSQLVGSEQVAGIDADHYTFTIDGLGGGSGAQVDANSGEVWVAKDGGYLLRYTVNTALVDTGSGEQYSLTMTLELTSVNQPVSIVMPSGCSQLQL
ncbi:MAG: DUF2510 domain-containing protein [Actinomycetota bacterium]|nr:DUF2510 domain-containing protein [Actinomycetota bacterium]